MDTLNKIHVRIMEGTPEAPGKLLGWTEFRAAVPGDGALHAAAEIQVPIDEAGIVGYLSLHWVDVNVAINLPAPPLGVAPGVIVKALNKGPIIRVGPAAGGLAPIVVRLPISINMKAGHLGAQGHS